MDEIDFAVLSAEGLSISDEEFKSIDPKGQKAKGERFEVWKSGMGKSRFLMKLLNRLGTDGWEVVGNVHTGYYPDVYLLLKRPVG